VKDNYRHNFRISVHDKSDDLYNTNSIHSVKEIIALDFLVTFIAIIFMISSRYHENDGIGLKRMGRLKAIPAHLQYLRYLALRNTGVVK